MGVSEKKKMMEGVKTHKHKLSQFRNKKIVIDSLSIIHKMMRYMIVKDINYIDNCGQNINELHIVLSLAINFLRFGITPIFVFDGKPNDHRKIVIEKRKKKYDKMIDDKDIKKNTKKIYKPSRRKINWCINLLKSIGITVIENDNLEADPICAKLCMDDHNVIGVVSNDIDILLMGAKSLITIQNLNSCEIEMITKYDFIENFNKIFDSKVGSDNYLRMNNIIEICVLLGNDYCNRIKINSRYGKFDEILLLYKLNNCSLYEVMKMTSINRIQKHNMIYSYYNYHLNDFDIECDIDDIIIMRNQILLYDYDTSINHFDYDEFRKIAKYFISEYRINFYDGFFRDMKKFINRGRYENYEMKKYPIDVIFDSYDSIKSKINISDTFDRWK